MVFSFFSTPSPGLEHVVTRSVGMLGDARHSFDLATLALLTDTDAGDVADDIRTTDDRINQTEHALRSELVVHVSVQGAVDIGSVLGLILLIKKIERIGDQAKNILDLATKGISLAGAPDTETMLAERREISSMFADVAASLAEPDESRLAALTGPAEALLDTIQTRIDAQLVSDAPGSEAVPRAIYDRYLKRIVANLLGVARTAHDPLPPVGPVDDLED